VALLKGAFEERDQAKSDLLVKELNMYWLDQAVEFRFPQEYSYRVWWPRLKNYSMETNVDYVNTFSFAPYIWVDQDLKKEMGY